MHNTSQHAMRQTQSAPSNRNRELVDRVASVETEDSVVDTSSIEPQENTINISSVDSESSVATPSNEYQTFHLTRSTKGQTAKGLDENLSDCISTSSSVLHTRYNLRERKQRVCQTRYNLRTRKQWLRSSLITEKSRKKIFFVQPLSLCIFNCNKPYTTSKCCCSLQKTKFYVHFY